MNSVSIGSRAEQQACKFLTGHGLSLVKQNFQCKMGEIDLIMRDGRILVFVEVRFRQHASHGTGAETITVSKINKILRTAQLFRQINPGFQSMACRFDVISMSSLASIDSKPDWIQNAFTAD